MKNSPFQRITICAALVVLATVFLSSYAHSDESLRMLSIVDDKISSPDWYIFNYAVDSRVSQDDGLQKAEKYVIDTVYGEWFTMGIDTSGMFVGAYIMPKDGDPFFAYGGGGNLNPVWKFRLMKPKLKKSRYVETSDGKNIYEVIIDTSGANEIYILAGLGAVALGLTDTDQNGVAVSLAGNALAGFQYQYTWFGQEQQEKKRSVKFSFGGILGYGTLSYTDEDDQSDTQPAGLGGGFFAFTYSG